MWTIFSLVGLIITTSMACNNKFQSRKWVLTLLKPHIMLCNNFFFGLPVESKTIFWTVAKVRTERFWGSEEERSSAAEWRRPESSKMVPPTLVPWTWSKVKPLKGEIPTSRRPSFTALCHGAIFGRYTIWFSTHGYDSFTNFASHPTFSMNLNGLFKLSNFALSLRNSQLKCMHATVTFLTLFGVMVMFHSWICM